MPKFFLVYKTTNTVTGMFYVGVHRTFDLEDGYLGSGKKLNNARAVYGDEVFRREILFYCESEDEMFAKEAEIVNKEFLRDPKTYNMALGGRSKFLHPEYKRPIRRGRRRGRKRQKAT